MSVSSSGFVPIDELNALRPNTTESEIEKRVKCNDKQRFAFGRGEGAKIPVRAYRCHSPGVAKVINDRELLLPISSPDELSEIIAHRTYFSALSSIEKDGLSQTSRAHVDLSEKVTEAERRGGGVI